MRPPGIRVAAKWARPPGTLSQGDSIWRSAVSARCAFIFRASGQASTTNEVTICETGGSSLAEAVPTASGGFVRAHETVATTTKAKPVAAALILPPHTYGTCRSRLEPGFLCALEE